MSKKVFNTTGNCHRHRHYMMDNSAKVAKVMDLVLAGHYFSINRPRQYGKTTTLFEIADRLRLSGEFMPIEMNFQGLDQQCYESDDRFAEMVAGKMAEYFEYEDMGLHRLIKDFGEQAPPSIDTLSTLITKMAHFSPKKLVLLIDEVDASSNYGPFLSFLGMLRAKYLARERPQQKTFHSVMLVGVHDIKSLKFKLRNPDDAQYNSPWNIAVDFRAEMEFLPHEIVPMLQEYAGAEGIGMDAQAIADRIFYHTAGYPFLASRICQIVAEDILPKTGAKQWTEDDIEAAVRLLYLETNTNFDSLIKNLENHRDLYDLVHEILIDGQTFSFNPHNATIHKGIVYGLFKQNGVVKMHNRIYEQIVYNYLISNNEIKYRVQAHTQGHRYERPDGSLDFPLVLRRFQAYMKEHFASKDKDFWEKHWRLLFLAFMRPILNGKGHDFKEAQASEEARLDAVVTYGPFRYVLELKRWYGPEAHRRGLMQLHGYLDRLGLDEGFLLIFDHRREAGWKEEWEDVDGKRIFAVWV